MVLVGVASSSSESEDLAEAESERAEDLRFLLLFVFFSVSLVEVPFILDLVLEKVALVVSWLFTLWLLELPELPEPMMGVDQSGKTFDVF